MDEALLRHFVRRKDFEEFVRPAPPRGCPAWTFASPPEPSCKSGRDVRLSGLDVRKSA